MAPEGRKPLLLLPRSIPSTQVGEANESTKPSSIFGTGKPRDINKPEIKQLEERLEQTLSISKQKVPSASSENTSANNSANAGNDSISSPTS